MTSAGKAFACHCEQLLHQYADVRADLKRFGDGEAGDFRIAAIPRVVNGTFPFVISHFKKENPAVRVTMQEIFSRQGIRYLREDLADLAIIYDSVDMKGFEIMPYKRDTIWVVGKRDHPLFLKHSGKKPVYFRESLDYKQISFHEGGVLDELVAEARRKKGQIPQYDLKVLRVNSLMKCIEAGLGLGIIGERESQPYLQNSNLQGLQLADKWASRNLVLRISKRAGGLATVRKFLEYLVESESA